MTLEPYHYQLLKICLALFFAGGSVILVLMVVVKVGEYLEARRTVVAALRRSKAAIRQSKFQEAVNDDMYNEKIWGPFYDELRKHRQQAQ